MKHTAPQDEEDAPPSHVYPLSVEEAFQATHKPCGCFQVFLAIALSTTFSTLGQISYALAYLEDTK